MVYLHVGSNVTYQNQKRNENTMLSGNDLEEDLSVKVTKKVTFQTQKAAAVWVKP